MNLRRTAVALVTALTLAACSDAPPTSPPVTATPPNSAIVPAVHGGGLALPITVPLQGGGVFQGTLNITTLALNSAGQLVASGTLVGQTIIRGVVTQVNETFTNVLLGLLAHPSGQCRILFLDVGPIFLDVLGLQVRTSRITVDITAVAGPGNLLGNLLCQLAHLLDQNPLNLTLIQNLLNQINVILAGL